MSDALDEIESASLQGPRFDECPGGASAHREQAVYRLRDLRGPARWIALAFVVALAFPPAYAFARAVPDWAPAADPAFMGLRALDVGTGRTPLVGQPSTSGAYVESAGRVHHPGASDYYLLAVPVRVFGGIGMLLVSVLIVGGSILISAWAVFRQLGPRGGVLAAVILGAIAFTTGAWSMINPVSSVIAGYPLLCSSILLWCLLCGDLRLLPLTTAVVSFTAQQHLSVEPTAVVLTVGVLGGVGMVLARRSHWREPPIRRELELWCVGALVVAAVMWFPVLLDQLAGEGNLSRIAEYTASSDRQTLGLGTGIHAVVNTLGLPPVLGTTNLSGKELLDQPSAFTWLSAAVVVGLVVFLGLRWRRTSPRRSLLTVMVAISAAAGLATASSVPVGLEQIRLEFYHWVFVLTFFTYLVVGLGLIDRLHTTLRDRRWLSPPLLVAVLVVIVVPSALNPVLDRTSNVFGAVNGFWKREHFDRLSRAVLAHRDELGDQTVLLQGRSPFSGYREALAFNLAEHGVDVRHPHTLEGFVHVDVGHPQTVEGFVHDDHLVDAETVDSALVLILDRLGRSGRTPPGRLIAQIDQRAQYVRAAASNDDADDPLRPTDELLGPTDELRRSTVGIDRFRLYLLNRRELLEFATPQELGTAPTARDR